MDRTRSSHTLAVAVKRMYGDQRQRLAELTTPTHESSEGFSKAIVRGAQGHTNVVIRDTFEPEVTNLHSQPLKGSGINSHERALETEVGFAVVAAIYWRNSSRSRSSDSTRSQRH